MIPALCTSAGTISSEGEVEHHVVIIFQSIRLVGVGPPGGEHGNTMITP